MREPIVDEVYEDNGELSHYVLIDADTGEKLWSQDPEKCKAMGFPVKNDILLGVMPRELTAENGAKYLLNGEFHENIELSNPEYCGCGRCDYCHEVGEDEEETYMHKVTVSWTTIKDIYRKIVEHYVA